MTRSLPQEQDSVAKFSLEADFKEMIMEGSHTSYTLLSQSSDLILHPDQELCFSSQLATTSFFLLRISRGQTLLRLIEVLVVHYKRQNLALSSRQSDVQILRFLNRPDGPGSVPLYTMFYIRQARRLQGKATASEKQVTIVCSRPYR